jgi:hypothetical protein
MDYQYISECISVLITNTVFNNIYGYALTLLDKNKANDLKTAYIMSASLWINDMPVIKSDNSKKNEDRIKNHIDNWIRLLNESLSKTNIVKLGDLQGTIIIIFKNLVNDSLVDINKVHLSKMVPFLYKTIRELLINSIQWQVANIDLVLVDRSQMKSLILKRKTKDLIDLTKKVIDESIKSKSIAGSQNDLNNAYNNQKYNESLQKVLELSEANVNLKRKNTELENKIENLNLQINNNDLNLTKMKELMDSMRESHKQVVSNLTARISELENDLITKKNLFASSSISHNFNEDEIAKSNMKSNMDMKSNMNVKSDLNMDLNMNMESDLNMNVKSDDESVEGSDFNSDFNVNSSIFNSDLKRSDSDLNMNMNMNMKSDNESVEDFDQNVNMKSIFKSDKK